jgi:hypothetical protein
MLPTLSAPAAELALSRYGGDVEAAAAWVLDADVEAELAAAAVARRKAAAAAGFAAGAEADAQERTAIKARVLARYAEGVDTADKTYRPSLPQAALAAAGGSGAPASSGAARNVRYVDGRAVVLPKGQKYVVESVGPPEDPATFVALKIKRKGARGPGPGWSK